MKKNSFDTEKYVKHWIDSAGKDFVTMQNMFETKDFHWALFIGHLVIEKLLKAHYVKSNKKQAIPIHNLLLLADKAQLKIPKKYEEMFDTITTFNISARYDSDTEDFYKLCTKEFTSEWIDNIKEIREWITKQLKK